jgi:hypothetical protein
MISKSSAAVKVSTGSGSGAGVSAALVRSGDGAIMKLPLSLGLDRSDIGRES